MINSIEFYKRANNSVNDLELGIFDATGALLVTAPKLSKSGTSSIEKLQVVFNYVLPSAGTYSIGIVSGNGQFCYGPATYPQTESSGILSITANNFPGNIFNIDFSTSTVGATTSPVPSTSIAGTYDYYVTQTVNGCISPPAVVTVNVSGITSTTSSRTCLGGSAKLKATASDGYTISWYDVPSGGTAITNGVSNTGSSSEFTTPSLTANKTYYAQASKGSCTSNRVPVQAFAGGFEWNGNSGDQTSTTSNWTSCQGNQEQMSSSTVIVSVQANKPQPKLNSNLEVANLILEGNASLNLNGYTLTARSISGTGLLVGGGTSKVVLNANGNSTIRMDQSIVGTTNLLESLVINNNSATVVLDNPLLVQKTLSITGSSTLNSNGNLTLLATESSNANIASLAGGGTVLGNVHVQSFMKGSNIVNRSFRTISPPVHNVKSPSKGFGIASYKTWMYVTGPGGEANGFDASPTNGHTIKYYNETAKNNQNQYLYPANATTEYITQGKGIYFYFRGKKDNTAGDKFVKVNGNYGVPENVLMDYYGEINSGDISPAITYTNHAGEASDNGFNLIGNPYPSVIDWESPAIIKNNVDPTVWVQKQDGSFAVYSTLATQNGGSRYLLPGQGFFIKATGPNPSVKFTENAKVVNVAPAVRFLSGKNVDVPGFSTTGVKVSSAPVRPLSKLGLTLIKDEYSSDETVVVLKEESNKTFDEHDIVYMGEGPVTLTSVTPDGKYLAINVLPEEQVQSVINLYATAAASGDYKFKVSNLSGLENSAVFLQDSYAGKIVNLQADDEYNFSIDKSISSSFGANRFKILLVPPTTLPVKLVSFKAAKQVSGVELNWTTMNEQNSSVFELQRSLDNKNFEPIGTVMAAGNSVASLNYSFTDNSPAAGMNYYRLKMRDKDDLYIYSAVVPVDFSVRGVADVQVYPNPFRDVLKADVSKNAGDVQMSLFDLSGRKLLTSTSGELNAASMKAGVYVVEVRSADGAVLGSCKVRKD